MFSYSIFSLFPFSCDVIKALKAGAEVGSPSSPSGGGRGAVLSHSSAVPQQHPPLLAPLRDPILISGSLGVIPRAGPAKEEEENEEDEELISPGSIAQIPCLPEGVLPLRTVTFRGSGCTWQHGHT